MAATQDRSGPAQDREQDQGRTKLRTYLLFGAMIATSTVVMFVLTYTNVESASHIWWSEERVYMAVLMGSAMALIMLGYMWGRMYRDTVVNLAIVGLAIVVGLTALTLSRTQAFVDDREYMKGMIPHHSIAILTSENADIDDLRVRELAEGIARAQREEIAEMEWLIRDIAENGEATTPDEAAARAVPDFSRSD